jgi:hypothetical protein
LFGSIPTVFTRAASAILSPSGDNNDILVTAKATGTAGNSLTAAVVIASGGNALSVTETDGDVVITSGSGYSAVVSGTLTPDATGRHDRGADSGGFPNYVSGSFSDFPIISVAWQGTGGTSGRWFIGYLADLDGSSNWRSEIKEFALHPTPDLATGWEPAGVVGDAVTPTGTPAVTLSAATVSQALALSQSSLSVTLTNASGNDGTGVLAAVSPTPLTGGI